MPLDAPRDPPPDPAKELAKTLFPLLLKLPNPDTRPFECEMYKVINAKFEGGKADWATIKSALELIVEQAVNCGEDGKRAAYAALYLLCTMTRRGNRLEEYRKALEDNEKLAAGRASYDHLWAMLYSSRRDDGDLRRALIHATEARRKIGDNPGLHIGFDHHYAEIVALNAETGAGRRDESQIAEALRLAVGVVKDEPTYAKFHATAGRLKALKDDLDAAERDVLKAISLEADNWDSASRRVEYKGILTRIQLERQRKSIEGEVKEVRRIAEETKLKHIEVLGVFAGVLALVLAGMAGLFQKEPEEAENIVLRSVGSGILLMMLGGTILVAFGGLGVSVHERRLGPFLAVLLGAILFALAGCATWYIFINPEAFASWVPPRPIRAGG